MGIHQLAFLFFFFSFQMKLALRAMSDFHQWAGRCWRSKLPRCHLNSAAVSRLPGADAAFWARRSRSPPRGRRPRRAEQANARARHRRAQMRIRAAVSTAAVQSPASHQGGRRCCLTHPQSHQARLIPAPPCSDRWGFTHFVSGDEWSFSELLSRSFITPL